MNVIYYNVSGKTMEILQFLLSFLAEEFGKGDFAPIVNFLKENSFDFEKILQNFSPIKLIPIIAEWFSGKNKSPSANSTKIPTGN